MPRTRVGLMGFGRIGRDLFRLLYQHPTIQVAAINDIADHKGLEYLLRFDTIQGRFPTEVSVHGDHLYVDGRQIPLLAERREEDVPWNALGVDIVIEATGKPVTRAQVERHLDNGAQRVILCVPPEEPPDATIVIGVNDDFLGTEHRIVSNASCTAHAAAPIVKILHGAFGIKRAFLSTVHAYTNQQRLADVPSEDKRRGRAAAENIIPQATSSAEMVMDLVPELQGRIQGMAMNVPVPNGSLVDLVCWHEKPVDVTAINEVVRTAIAGSYSHVLAYEDDPIVSSDVLKTPHSGTFDSLGTMVLGERVSKTLTWFDNSWGYSNRVVDLIHRLATLDTKEAA
ncbi:MAG: glyceraldehyde 3-phosphate dehydrogenase NAD-binding domain-containing protein [Acidobacteriota bacterium]